MMDTDLGLPMRVREQCDRKKKEEGDLKGENRTG